LFYAWMVGLIATSYQDRMKNVVCIAALALARARPRPYLNTVEIFDASIRLSLSLTTLLATRH
jgi:hypothetical protein